MHSDITDGMCGFAGAHRRRFWTGFGGFIWWFDVDGETATLEYARSVEGDLERQGDAYDALPDAVERDLDRAGLRGETPITAAGEAM